MKYRALFFIIPIWASGFKSRRQAELRSAWASKLSTIRMIIWKLGSSVDAAHRLHMHLIIQREQLYEGALEYAIGQ